MMYMVTETWPSKSSAEVGEKSREVLQMSQPHVKRLGTYLTPGGDGIKGYALFEAEKGHDEEAFKEIIAAFSHYLTVDGFKFTVEPVLPPEEALGFIGINL